MNKATALARGKYLFYLNAGDEVLLTSKNEINAFLKKLDSCSPDIFIFNTLHSNVGADGKISNWRSIANNNIDLICFGMLFSHQGCAILKNTFDELGGYSIEFGITGDWHFLNHLYLKNKIFEKIDVTFAKTFPFGVSSDLLERTLERYKLIRPLYSKSNKFEAIKEMYLLFFAVMHNNQLPPITIAGEISRLTHGFEYNLIKTIKSAKQLYLNKLIKGGVQVYGPEMWHLPDNLNNLKSHEFLDSSRLIFLISLPRSGSTLFQRLLEGSSQVASTGEPWICLPILSMFNNEISQHKCNEELILKAHKYLSQELGLPEDFYKQGIKSYLSNLYDQILLKTKKRYYLDKTPRYVHIIDEIKECFPQAKFILLTRNPLEIINSYASTWANDDFRAVFNNPYFSYGFKNGFVRLINFIQKNKHDKNVLCVDYSNIIGQNESILSEINAFLGTQDLTFDIKHNNKAKSRLLGDPKNINKTDKIVKLHKDSPVEMASKMKNREYLRKILNQIPKSVFNYFNLSKEDLFPSSLKAEKPINNDAVIPSNMRKLALPTLSESGKKKKIGIAITTFNNSNSIAETLNSVAHQMCTPDSIIISDDCSTDNTIEVIKKFMDRFPDLPINLIQHPKNIGISKNRDHALKALETEYVTHLDGDDLISPLKLQKELSAIETFDSDVAFSDIKVVFKDSNTIQNTRFYHKKSREELVLSLINRSYPVPRDLMIRKDVYLGSGGFSATINLFEDWHHKQRLAWHSREKSWVHSGCVGTFYNRREPGLSKRSTTRLLIAQLRVLAMNYDIIEHLVSTNNKVKVHHLLQINPEIHFPYLHRLSDNNFQTKDLLNLLSKVRECNRLTAFDTSSDATILDNLNHILA